MRTPVQLRLGINFRGRSAGDLRTITTHDLTPKSKLTSSLPQQINSYTLWNFLSWLAIERYWWLDSICKTIPCNFDVTSIIYIRTVARVLDAFNPRFQCRRKSGPKREILRIMFKMSLYIIFTLQNKSSKSSIVLRQ